jgi:hypothetical protein
VNHFGDHALQFRRFFAGGTKAGRIEARRDTFPFGSVFHVKALSAAYRGG